MRQAAAARQAIHRHQAPHPTRRDTDELAVLCRRAATQLRQWRDTARVSRRPGPVTGVRHEPPYAGSQGLIAIGPQVFRAPVVVLVQNNGYAISVPLARQTGAPSLAHKDIGYGSGSEQVDG